MLKDPSMLKDRVKRIKDRVEQRVKQEVTKVIAERAARQAIESTPASTSETRSDLERLGEEPPVVARLMVEIRSDGSRTIARGALHDELSNEQVALEARGSTPLELAGQLAKTIMTLPLSLGQLSRARKEREELTVAGEARPPRPADDSDDPL